MSARLKQLLLDIDDSTLDDDDAGTTWTLQPERRQHWRKRYRAKSEEDDLLAIVQKNITPSGDYLPIKDDTYKYSKGILRSIDDTFKYLKGILRSIGSTGANATELKRKGGPARHRAEEHDDLR